MQYRITGDGWTAVYDAHRGALGREWEIEDESGTRHRILVERLEDLVYRVTLNGASYTLSLLPGNRPGKPLRYLLEERYMELLVQDELDLLEEELGAPSAAGGRREIQSVMPGVIRQVLVREGDLVEEDAPILILEAMKMENEVRAPLRGIVAQLHVAEGRTVAAGEKLAVIRAEETPGA